VMFKKHHRPGVVTSTYRRDLPRHVIRNYDDLVTGARAAGAATDGRLYPDPDIGDDPPEGARVLVAKAEGDLASVQRHAEDDLRKLAERRHRLAAKLRHLLGIRDGGEAEIGAVEQSRDDQRVLLAKDPHDQHRRHEGGLNVAGLAGLAALLLIGCAEAPLAKFVLDLLGASNIVTWLATFALGLGQLLGAHLLGAERNEANRKETNPKHPGADRVVAVLLATSLVATLLFLGIVRATVLGNDQRTLAHSQQGFVRVSPVVAIFLFMAIQLIFDAVAFTIAAKRHSRPVAGLKQTISQLRRLRLVRRLLGWRIARVSARLAAITVAEARRLREYVAWGHDIIAHYYEAIAAHYEGLIAQADLGTAAALNHQARPVLTEPAWFKEYRERATELENELPTSPLTPTTAAAIVRAASNGGGPRRRQPGRTRPMTSHRKASHS
jgi:hypothetical protein